MAQKKQESMLDIFSKGATAFIKAKTAQKKAELEMKSKISLKEIERKQDLLSKIAEREHITPYQKMMGQLAQRQEPGIDMSAITGQKYAPPAGGAPGGPGAPPGAPAGRPGMSRFRPEFGAKGITMKRRGLKEIVEGIYQKPEDQWTSGERGMVNQYRRMQEKSRGEKAPTTAQRKILGEVRALKSKNATVEDIQEHIRFSGYEIEDFAEEFEGYTPEEKGFCPWQQ